MAVDTATAIRRLIIRLYKDERPAFGVIKHLQGALREALALDRALSVDDLPTTRADLAANYTVTTGNAVTTGGGGLTIRTAMGDEYGDNMDEAMYRTRESRQRAREASLVDQALSAMDQAVARSGGGSGPDRFAAILQALPHLDLIYTSDRDLEAVKSALRSEIAFRLGERLPSAEAVPEPPELPALTDREAS